MPRRLSEEERKLLLDRMKRDWAEKEAIPPEKKVPVPTPEKYAFPPGFDDEGNPFSVSEAERQNEKTGKDSSPGDSPNGQRTGKGDQKASDE